MLWDTADLTASGPGSFQLVLNTTHPRIRNLLDKPEDPENRELMEVVEVIRYDTARQMLQYALDRDDLVDNTGPSGLSAVIRCMRSDLSVISHEQLSREHLKDLRCSHWMHAVNLAPHESPADGASLAGGPNPIMDLLRSESWRRPQTETLVATRTHLYRRASPRESPLSLPP